MTKSSVILHSRTAIPGGSGWSNHIPTNRHQKNAMATKKKGFLLPKLPLHVGPSISVVLSVSAKAGIF